ncbi:hypothetical protein IE077_003434, partial [Cardiosporidium cionae]
TCLKGAEIVEAVAEERESNRRNFEPTKRNFPSVVDSTTAVLSSERGTIIDTGNITTKHQPAYENFCRSVERTQAFAENKKVLYQLHGEAKTLGEGANAARNEIIRLKFQLEKVRVQQALQFDSLDSKSFPQSDTPYSQGEEEILEAIEIQKQKHQQYTRNLSKVQNHTERIQQ